MIDYSKGKIYKIIDNTNGNIYIGSTCLPTLAHRLAHHKNDYKLYLKGKRGLTTSFYILENKNYDIILLEEVNCTTKDQLLQRERFYIDTMNCVNLHKPARTKEEYVEINKNRCKQFYQTKKNDINKKLREKYPCPCGSVICVGERWSHEKTKKHTTLMNNLEKI